MKYNYMTVLLAVAIISSVCVNRHREYDERETTEEAVEVIEVTAVDVIEECADTVAEATDVFDTEVVVVEDPVVVVEETPVVEEQPKSIKCESSEDIIVTEEETASDSNDKVYDAAEQMPSFPGGDAAMMKFLSGNIRYPEMAAQNGIQGTVILQFVVKKDGSIGEVKVVRSKDPDLDREAVRVVKSFPRFNPGYMDGEAVNTWFTLPVRFKLQ